MLEKKRKYLVYKEGNSNLKVLDGTKLILNKCKQIVDHKLSVHGKGQIIPKANFLDLI